MTKGQWDNEELPERDKPDRKVSIAASINSGIRSIDANDPSNWYRARLRGWTREQFNHWVLTGEEP